ncbi:MAG: hypothetical protein CO031_01230 [Candidatus Nealsonbacteria bacterium CG_4_9_14_0_2_um_filter_37_38]|uniref:Thioredoxin domain-containing protein n=1 Tax=Candidatus Nealsonbacteria bacterium CG_4_10_14_0_8_um_filter_37_14 TaxID=1974684 RepID=A0A2M7R617_9BACT|nr:MAG: hypothetical protein COV63_02785 [Candidatus Nealsonbacteria bacterium CG11_big_fil_rev_8_21_14_0_20_37_68]PIW91849.1 MAG: hypothetical protein COZ89_03015 [Candidatus Nealsonbacteria bacterium CG_4_8_14_3_um_filter_37_23]PIY88408.1 MAG: hypothetical protein COY73_03990 [Candidatus Nealsonbacteria bacterium CG_4_10_14_0_8_um_filter_37_14]PJC51714.1 MAG: hypothetical protein CO031_01230 [Candidatus Nealsonbacteria bacterium CG_4_9_14_0_2_um_filter_37_38]
MKKWIFAILIFCFALGWFNFVFAQGEVLQINFFYSAICPHCDEEEEFLKELEKKYPEIVVNRYEVISHPQNKEILQDFYEKYQVPEGKRGWIPVTLTPTRYFIGFNQQIGEDIENCLKECLGEESTAFQKIKIPIFGSINISKLSLPLLTVILGAVDGLNPCAMWVLLFLIALLINTRSRKRMWFIGGTFLAVSGIFYYLILAAWLNLFLVISYVNLTRILIGVFALGVGIWQIKNFIQFRPGVCKVSDGKLNFQERIKNWLKNHTEKLAASPLTFAIFGGIILLAIGLNLVEFFCSAGLPAIYTKILTLNHLNPLIYYLYLLLYTFIFILDDLIIFSLAAITLTKIGFTEKYNYWATLFGGILIFALGFLLIFKPEFLMFG